MICCAELKIVFQPEALEWPYILGERELAPRGEAKQVTADQFKF